MFPKLEYYRVMESYLYFVLHLANDCCRNIFRKDTQAKKMNVSSIFTNLTMKRISSTVFTSCMLDSTWDRIDIDYNKHISFSFALHHQKSFAYLIKAGVNYFQREYFKQFLVLYPITAAVKSDQAIFCYKLCNKRETCKTSSAGWAPMPTGSGWDMDAWLTMYNCRGVLLSSFSLFLI
jgi:hypothetical protein